MPAVEVEKVTATLLKAVPISVAVASVMKAANSALRSSAVAVAVAKATALAAACLAEWVLAEALLEWTSTPTKNSVLPLGEQLQVVLVTAWMTTELQRTHSVTETELKAAPQWLE